MLKFEDYNSIIQQNDFNDFLKVLNIEFDSDNKYFVDELISAINQNKENSTYFLKTFYSKIKTYFEKLSFNDQKQYSEFLSGIFWPTEIDMSTGIFEEQEDMLKLAIKNLSINPTLENVKKIWGMFNYDFYDTPEWIEYKQNKLILSYDEILTQADEDFKINGARSKYLFIVDELLKLNKEDETASYQDYEIDNEWNYVDEINSSKWKILLQKALENTIKSKVSM
ncbi:hypothetical protein NPA08_04250 [Mycoplasmopsis citelli]|uniref:hypothetical protein n=1 Tax=Mycoplasmopsis citelli TaxID=171281 RepID=UPI0021139396|nr:hypothetical protein [Mycoplasmopsis citelli]UUD36131.1 hypothetical protein NPA08_04250 [Mycoplasmopsis citelli]